MRILLLSVINPLDNSGFGKLAKRLFNTLRFSGHQLGCLVCSKPDESDILYENLNSSGLFSLGIYIFPEQFFYYAFDKIRSLSSRNPSNLLQSRSEYFHKKINTICDEMKIDIIHCFRIETTLVFPLKSPVPVVFDYFDSSTQHRFRELKFYSISNANLLGIPKALINLITTFRIESNLLHKFIKTGVFTVISKTDAYVLNKLCPDIKIHQIPASIEVPMNRVFCHSDTLNTSNTIGFYGYMGGAWNLDALNQLVKQVMPEVLKKIPNVILKITGTSMPNKILKLSSRYRWIEVTPDIDDISCFLKGVGLCCFPYRLGSGIKTKVIECMALGVPVITTSLGVEGFNDKQRNGILVADTVFQMVHNIIQIIENHDNIRYELIQKNYDIVKKEFSLESQAQSYIKAYEMAIRLHTLNK